MNCGNRSQPPTSCRPRHEISCKAHAAFIVHLPATAERTNAAPMSTRGIEGGTAAAEEDFPISSDAPFKHDG